MNKISNQKIIVLGARGMLAGDLVPHLRAKGAALLLTDVVAGERQGLPVEALDITNRGAVKSVFQGFKPDWVINCAAYTAVDRAEEEHELSLSVNSMGPLVLAKTARECSTKLIHFSTDYVFGRKAVNRKSPWKEDDVVDPCGIYGHGKFYGEEFVRDILPESHLLIRTSWLHGVQGANFVHTMLRLGREQGRLKVVDDQIGSPTWAWWLGGAVVELMEKEARGTFHATSRGDISWYDFATEIFSQTGISVELVRQTTEELRRAAPRPAYSTLCVEKIEKFLGRPCPSWQEGLKGHLAIVKDMGMEF